jgi:hypothetical protein
VKKIAQNVARTCFLSNKSIIKVEKITQFGLFLLFSNKLPTGINRPMGENSPNLVTLDKKQQLK